MRKWMREIRNVKGLSQSEMAKLAGISPSNYADIERGFRNPSTQRAKELGKALGVDWTLFYE